MCLLFETICVRDGSPLHLEWHTRRMDRACREVWGTGFPAGPVNAIKVPDEFSTGVARCRIIYGPDIRDVGFSSYARKAVRSFRLVEGGHIDYHLKYADRSALDALYALRKGCDEIIIVRHGLITDTSLSNLVFFDGRRWFTPATPLLNGTCRERLLAEGWMEEADIRPEDLEHYLGCKLINAMRDPGEEEMIPVSDIFH